MTPGRPAVDIGLAAREALARGAVHRDGIVQAANADLARYQRQLSGWWTGHQAHDAQQLAAEREPRVAAERELAELRGQRTAEAAEVASWDAVASRHHGVALRRALLPGAAAFVVLLVIGWRWAS